MANQQDIDTKQHVIAVEEMRRLGPGETPKRAADVVSPEGHRKHGEHVGSPSLNEAEEHGNPIIPRDGTGHKVHPSDAYSVGVLANVDKSHGFGGSGLGLQADTRGAAPAMGHGAERGYTVREQIDPQTGELIRQKIGPGGEVLDEQREPPPPSRVAADTARTQPRRSYTDEGNGPIL